MVEGGLVTVVANLPTLSFLLRDLKIWSRLRKGHSWSNLLRPFSSKNRGTEKSGSVVSGQKPDPSLGSGNFHALEPVPPRPYRPAEGDSQRSLIYITESIEVKYPNMRPNDSLA